MRSAVIDLASQPIRNRHPNPSGEVGTFGWGSNSASLYPVTVETDATLARTGKQCIKATRQSTLNVTTSSAFMTGAGGTITSWAVSPGETISASVYVRPELAGRSARLRFILRDTAGATVGGGAQGTFTPVTAGVYNLVTISQVVPAGAAVAAAASVDTQTTDGSLATLGERVWHDSAMLVNGSLPAYYADGSFPDWSWSGTPNASESVGYPYTLESIAGAPIASLSAVGSVALTLAQMPALSGRTTYVVSKRLKVNDSAAVANIALTTLPVTTPPETGNIRTVPISVSAGAPFEMRPQGKNGASSSIRETTVLPAVGDTSVISVAQSDGLNSHEISVNGSTPKVLNLAGVDGYTNPGIQMVSGAIYDNPLYVIQYVGFHPVALRNRIVAWLARRYGAPIPAGF